MISWSQAFAFKCNLAPLYGWDIEAEENERYNRRPRAADGPVERSTESGFLARQPCLAALVVGGLGKLNPVDP